MQGSSKTWIGILALAVIYIALWIFRSSSSSPFVDPQLAQNWVAEGALLVDVRTAKEYKSNHPDQAINLPLHTLQAHFSVPQPAPHPQLKDKDQKVIVYCRSGNRSGRTKKILEKAGYTQVYNLGGVDNWPK